MKYHCFYCEKELKNAPTKNWWIRVRPNCGLCFKCILNLAKQVLTSLETDIDLHSKDIAITEMKPRIEKAEKLLNKINEKCFQYSGFESKQMPSEIWEELQEYLKHLNK